MAVAIVSVVIAILSVAIIVISLLMSPDSNGFSGALVGSGDLELFKYSKERGLKKVLKYSMLFGGLILMIFAIVLRVIA
ncbi:preprotein translocase subunit SecG [Mycoplasmopsis caviae]|uniref:Protein-export membrane protein SecG n=1 Tax=Mycoplasmopsis caviae TaxID=55603 RepID=A0A3P8MDI2_9BACT|nr:preprotein translocase subunit SecG [Mycoplasmopsis caviae]UUD35361.1 preprotein translocase subunit SecG [Mycoplasmopsis caviae]VDR41860.1 preprotein translocase subunit SecG [Mycoplasmopsis caviae]